MNHYEELGIHRDAATAEIREAYKLAARLLHPDMHRDQRLKDLAECQMRRLSDVVAMLVNPQERARYDAALASRTRPGQFPLLAADGGSELWHTAVQQWFWILLGSMTIGMGAWYGFARGTEAPPRIAAAENAAPGASVPSPGRSASVKNQRVRVAESAGERAAAQRPPLRHTVIEAPEPVGSVTPTMPVAAPPQAPNPEHTAMTLVQQPRPADVAPGGGEPRFSGQWLFAADTGEEERVGTYPARYVEFLLQEERGCLAGDYRAVYSGLDKAISPEVVFHVHGELPQGSAGTLEWESKAGAKGELELTLHAPNRLLVKWWTTQFGRQEALSSGMASLTRLKIP
jgi:hypothetical protein